MITVSIEPITHQIYTACRFLQSKFWGTFKSAHGWRQHRFLVRYTACECGSVECLVLIRAFRFGSIAYCPMGLDIPLQTAAGTAGVSLEEYEEILALTAQQIKQYLPKNTLCLRFDPPIDFESEDTRNLYIKSLLRKKNFSVAPVAIQPPDTVVLDLRCSQEELLSNMKPKWRYNIRLAEKKGVSVRRGEVSDIDIFYQLYETTARRDGIAVHEKSYYKKLLEQSGDTQNEHTPRVTLYIAEYNGEPLAAIITVFSQREAIYLYGASSNFHRNLMPAYLLQWIAVCDAKAYGSAVYDFYGIPPNDNENHPMHGLYRFKTGFGGKIIHRPGSIDVPLSPFYILYIAAERIRAFWFKKIKKLFKR